MVKSVLVFTIKKYLDIQKESNQEFCWFLYSPLNVSLFAYKYKIQLRRIQPPFLFKLQSGSIRGVVLSTKSLSRNLHLDLSYLYIAFLYLEIVRLLGIFYLDIVTSPNFGDKKRQISALQRDPRPYFKYVLLV